MLVGGQGLDAAVTAVVIGYQEALGTDHLSGTSSAKVHDGIFQRRLVEGENLFRRQFAAGGLQVFSVHLFEEGQQPHAFIGRSAQGDGQGSHHSKESFHTCTNLYKNTKKL